MVFVIRHLGLDIYDSRPHPKWRCPTNLPNLNDEIVNLKSTGVVWGEITGLNGPDRAI